MKYLKQLRKIDSEIFDNMGKTSQKTIDLVQDTLIQLSRCVEDESIQRDELGAIDYSISILLEVWNPKLKYDIDVLKRVQKIIIDWYEDVEFVNIALGIPREKG